MTDAPDATPEEPPVEEEPAEVELPKTGAEVWKERRALILSRNSAARERGQAPSTRAVTTIAEQRRLNAERDAAQLRAANGSGYAGDESG